MGGAGWSCAAGAVVVVFCAATASPEPRVPASCVSQDAFLSAVFIQQ